LFNHTQYSASNALLSAMPRMRMAMAPSSSSSSSSLKKSAAMPRQRAVMDRQLCAARPSP